VIRTNPKERGFDYVSGIHKQIQEFDTKEAGTVGYIDTEYGNKFVTEGANSNSALGQLESVASSKRKVMTEQDELQALIKSNSQTKFDDATSNANLRATFRVERRGRKRRLKDGTARGWKSGMELADERVEDIATARSMTYRNGKQVERESFGKLRRSSIFAEGNDKQGRRSKRLRRRERSSPQPDPVVSLPPHVTIKTESDVFEPQGQELKAVPTIRQRKTIKLISRGKSGVTVAPSKNDASPLAALADYGSDSDS
jgi:coiled-coil domain-containing protein 130